MHLDLSAPRMMRIDGRIYSLSASHPHDPLSQVAALTHATMGEICEGGAGLLSLGRCYHHASSSPCIMIHATCRSQHKVGPLTMDHSDSASSSVASSERILRAGFGHAGDAGGHGCRSCGRSRPIWPPSRAGCQGGSRTPPLHQAMNEVPANPCCNILLPRLVVDSSTPGTAGQATAVCPDDFRWSTLQASEAPAPSLCHRRPAIAPALLYMGGRAAV